jgi:MFS-type transporter involved in bile tolerance (Atg22 family)
MAVLIIVFAWLDYSWTRIAIIILGILLAVLALVGTCCCSAMAEAKAQAQPPAKATETADGKE